MRNPARIYPLLYKIGDIWTKYPDLRFGQLIENIWAQRILKDPDLFNIEDGEFEKLIDKYNKKYINKEPITKFPHNPEHPIGTCAKCGEEMVFNVPRLKEMGGYIHKLTGAIQCSNSKKHG